jgi:hypothetical protein
MKNNSSRSISTIAAVGFLLGAYSQSHAAAAASNLVTICTSAHAVTQASKCTAWQYNVYSATAYIESYPQVSPGPKVWTDPAYEYRLGSTITPTMGVKVCPTPLTPGTSFSSAAADPCPNNVLVSASTVVAAAPMPPAQPTFNPPPGNYAPRVITSVGLQGQPSVMLSDSTPGATIRYSIDGTIPSLSSPTYTGPVLLPIGAATFVQASAFASGTNIASPYTEAEYVIPLFPSDDFPEPIANLVTICTSATTTTQASKCTGWQYNFYSPAAYIESYPQVNPGSKGFTDPAYEYRLGSTIAATMGVKVCPSALLPGTSFSSTNADPCPNNVLITASTVIPSASLPASSVFLYNNELERDSCAYYRAVGAETTPTSSGPCKLNPDGSFVNGITKNLWMTEYYDQVLVNGSTEASALFVNINDLNFVRDHQAIIKPDGSASAAIVCNYAGPDFYQSIKFSGVPNNQAAVDAAIQSAETSSLSGINTLPCVAFDYGIAEPYLRFLVFNSAGKLASAVDLDGRGPKQIPNACTACHGTPHGEDPPEPSSTQPEPEDQVPGAGYIPFDEGNFLFSSATGYRQADQEAQIKLLNQIVLASANFLDPGSTSTQSVSALIHGWYDTYAPGTDTVTGSLTFPTQQLYAPPALAENDVYYDIYAPFCRSCHVANHVPSFLPPTNAAQLSNVLQQGNVCNPSATGTVAVMPNSKVAFDRFWTTHLGPTATPGTSASPGTDLAAMLQNYLGQSCTLHSFPTPIH